MKNKNQIVDKIKMKEIIKEIEEMGFEVWVDVNAIVSAVVVRKNDAKVALVYTDSPYTIDTVHTEFEKLNHYTKEKLFNLLLELYLEPRYYWVIKGLGKLDDEMAILSELDGKCGIGMFSVFGEPRTQFTKHEFEEIKEKLGFTLEFEPVEVE